MLGLCFGIFSMANSKISLADDFSDDQCLSQSADNKIKSLDDLIQKFKSDLMDVVDRRSGQLMMDKYSACPDHEPGTDQYNVISGVNITKKNDQEITIQYDVLGGVVDSDGEKHYKFVPKKGIRKFTYKTSITSKGLRFGNADNLILEDGFFLPADAVKTEFNVDILQK